MLPPKLENSTEKERESYIKSALCCKSDCENCGSWEALEDAGLAERKPLKAWAFLREVLE